MDKETQKALDDAAGILETEANQLAIFMEGTLKATLTLRTQEIFKMDPAVPHRVNIAIKNEIDRLRKIGTRLRSLIPSDTEETDA